MLSRHTKETKVLGGLHVGRVVKLYRKFSGLSQGGLAKELGVTQSTISLIEKGKGKLSSDVYDKYLNFVYKKERGEE